MLKDELKSLQKGILALLEAPHYQLLVTPPSHHVLQKARGWVVEFTWLRGETTIKKILLTSWVIKEKIAFENSFGFQAQEVHIQDIVPYSAHRTKFPNEEDI